MNKSTDLTQTERTFILSEDQRVEQCARAAHEMNLIYCEAHGDFSQHHWEAAPDWARKSAIMGAKGAIGGNTPEQSHENWLAEKKATGWKYGLVKDVEKKEHPCFVPYASLDPMQKFKDDLFIQSIKSMYNALSPFPAA